MILLSHPTGNEFVRSAASALAQAGLLKEFRTSISWDDKSWVNRVLPQGLREELNRRSFSESVRPLTKVYPWRELGRLFSERLNLSYFLRHEKGYFSVDSVYRVLDRQVAKRLSKLPGLRAVYAYEDGALMTFRRARELGLRCIYDLPIGYWRLAREIFQEEALREPEWAPILGGYQDSTEKLIRKDEELKLADVVIVPSTFVKETLEKAPEIKAPIKIIPFGAPSVNRIKKEPHKGKFRVIYVGALTQRKGISYLFRAASELSTQIELTLIGHKPMEKCLALERALKSYRWISSLPHERILEEMRRHDVLILPSLFEGLALVILEAMSQGLAVITTANTCGPDIIENGVDGFIVPIRSSDAIADKLLALHRNRDLLLKMQGEAIKKASLYSWERYHSQIIEAVG